MSTRAMPPCCKVRAEMALLGNRCAALAAAGQLAATKAIGSLWDQISGCGQGCTGLLQAPGLFVSLPFTLWRRSFPCHRMCCGPDTLLWFALAGFRSADMVGIDGHVRFLHHHKKTKVYTDVQSCLRMSAGTGTKVAW